MTGFSTSYTYTYDKNNRLTGSCETSEGITKTSVYTYDPNGNQLSKYAGVITESTENGETVGISDKTNSNVVLYSYDKYNRLKSVDTNGVKTSYSYAPDGLRHSKTADGNTTTFVYDNANIVAEITAEGTNKYYRGIEIIKNDDNLYYIYNGQGDVAMLTDTAGTTVADYEFDAYGNSDSENSVYNPFGYRGEYQDLCSGLIYLRNRYYDPSIGRFISEDPIKDGLNWYVYCRNNPIRYIDPTGYITEEEQKMYESGKMAPMAYSHLMNLTYQWYLADTEASKAIYHQWAEDFRATGYTTTNGTFPYVDEGIEFMPSKPSGLLSEEEHYFRNKLNLQFSWNAMQTLQERLPQNLRWDDSVTADLHQNTALSTGPNIKYVSACGHFEVVYNADHNILGEKNAPSDMGTYNYSNPTSNPVGHYWNDVYPYKSFGWFGWGYGNVKQ